MIIKKTEAIKKFDAMPSCISLSSGQREFYGNLLAREEMAFDKQHPAYVTPGSARRYFELVTSPSYGVLTSNMADWDLSGYKYSADELNSHVDRIISSASEPVTCEEIARELGCSSGTVHYRLKYGIDKSIYLRKRGEGRGGKYVYWRNPDAKGSINDYRRRAKYSSPQKKLVSLIEDSPNITVKSLCKAMGIGKQALQDIISNAIAAGLIKPDPENGGYITIGEEI